MAKSRETFKKRQKELARKERSKKTTQTGQKSYKSRRESRSI